jgi:murein DD-endopeptidase MepM/ murein hydrolase activator NlpD
LSELAVAVGDRIEAGQIVGRAGSTGRSTGPHLHYEIRVGSEPVNPARFLEAGKLLSRGEI